MQTLKQHAKRVIWVDTTPVPLNVTGGPERHNQYVIQYQTGLKLRSSQKRFSLERFLHLRTKRHASKPRARRHACNLARTATPVTLHARV